MESRSPVPGDSWYSDEQMADQVESPRRKVPYHVIIRVAGIAEAHPQTVEKVAKGLPVRGAVYFRILKAFQAEGISVPEPGAA